MRASRGTGKSEEHVSGAECIQPGLGEARQAARQYLNRALNHPRGEPEGVVITLERLRAKPMEVTAPPVSTLATTGPAGAMEAARDILGASGISGRAFNIAGRVLEAKRAMRGAALVSATGGVRLEADRARGVRAGRVGISSQCEGRLRRSLAGRKINTTTVAEALVLASKIQACPGVLAEICVSDDPHYSTGYVCTPGAGYVRLPNIKPPGSTRGGRVIFLKEGADPTEVARWLERTPVLVTEITTARDARGRKRRP